MFYFIVLIIFRFASFNKAFDFEKTSEATLTEAPVFKEKELRDEPTAPIAKLESLDELDLVSLQYLNILKFDE